MFQRFYVPGMISLIGILPIFYFKAQPWISFFKQNAMNVYLPKNGHATDGRMGFYEDDVVVRAAVKKKRTYYLDYYLDNRNEVLNHIRHAVWEQNLAFDTSSVVKVVFGSYCTFNDLVSVLDLQHMHENAKYAWVKDTVFLFAPRSPYSAIPNNFVGCGGNVAELINFEEEDTIHKILQEVWSNKYILLALFTFYSIIFYQKKGKQTPQRSITSLKWQKKGD